MYNHKFMFTIMKKTFEQPELMVVRINNNDVIATSKTLSYGDAITTTDVIEAGAAGRFRDFEDYSY